jgi:hypothetical protein
MIHPSGTAKFFEILQDDLRLFLRIEGARTSVLCGREQAHSGNRKSSGVVDFSTSARPASVNEIDVRNQQEPRCVQWPRLVTALPKAESQRRVVLFERMIVVMSDPMCCASEGALIEPHPMRRT